MSKKPTDGKAKSDLFAGFDDVLSKDKTGAAGGGGAGGKAARKDASATASASASADPIADLESVAKGSRPQTPRPGSSATGAVGAATGKKGASSTSTTATTGTAPGSTTTAAQGSEEKSGATGPTSTSTSEEKGKEKEAEADKETTKEKEEEQPTAAAGGGGGGGWWGGFGGLMGAASAAVKQAQSQAEQLAKELQKNEEAQKWAEHVRGNAALLRSYGGDLRHLTGEIRSRALPGLTNLLHTLAPPISSHERLQVLVTHDLHGYPSLDPLVHSVFARVMAQVEGGELVVVQKGHEAGLDGSRPRSSTAGWSDGPWWRDLSQKRDVGAVAGIVEGSKLARASAEAFADDHFSRMYGSDTATSGSAAAGVAEARRRADEATRSQSNPTRSSDIFLAVQAVRQDRTADEGLFAGAGAPSPAKVGKKGEAEGKTGAGDGDGGNDEDATAEISFAVYLHDPVHSLSFGSVSQAVPARWLRWLDLPEDKVVGAGKSSSPETDDEKKGVESEEGGTDSTDPFSSVSTSTSHLPPDIAALIAAGGLDPREWAAEWIEEALALAVGVVAQRYVASRMGVGMGTGVGMGAAEGLGLGTGAARTGKAEEAGAGELARAM